MSGRKFTFEANKTSTAPASTLFRLVADGGNWASWAKPIVVQSSWVRQGDPAPGGIGAIRKLGMWPVFVQEETIEYEQDRRHVYRLVGPRTPVNDYVGEVVLTPNASGGTDIRWSGSFTERVRGTGKAARAAMGGAVKFFAGQLVKEAERQAGSGSG
ncbi:MxaD family protein [Mycobacterium intermedium]|uniref:MxaD family protein n=1 Tax=Mycobacterium intermedium TaxID=28445 RepID=A0A1E3SES6_MYCIE|nr:SRPBCC family protein [Mycobacterium intermedium]MCV6963045.1 SRPBCC family protein [Mycobacterium intermedium]ODR00649.1 polyketide cyclase [Mycobacterium intermedium]OPE46306.1 MxaD family protein [Mycobacterium intermedium]ORA93158.1 MxaD family protein [Mycobacterium intermedium]